MNRRGPDWGAFQRLFRRPAKVFTPALLPGPTGAPSAPDAPDWDAMTERAAIMEYDGGLTRAEAEALAFRGLTPPREWQRR